MKFMIVLFALAAVALAEPVAQLLKHEEVHEENTYNVEYHLDDGTVVHERGHKINGEEGEVWAKSGSYKFTSPEGMTYEVTYSADEHGYVAKGDHLPKEPVV